MRYVLVFSMLWVGAWCSPAVLADNPQLYTWTDPQGVVHYSDRPPAQPAADLKTSDLPEFPPVDQAKLDQQQAALLAEVAALQRLAEAQAQAQAEARLAAAQSAAQEPPPAAPTTDEPSSTAPIYVDSAFVPRIYRANLYLPRRGRDHGASRARPTPSRPAISLLSRP